METGGLGETRLWWEATSFGGSRWLVGWVRRHEYCHWHNSSHFIKAAREQVVSQPHEIRDKIRRDSWVENREIGKRREREEKTKKKKTPHRRIHIEAQVNFCLFDVALGPDF